MKEQKTFEIACRRIRETDNAVLIHEDATSDDIWIPLSQVEEMHFDKNQYGTLVVTEWIAQQKGLL